MRPINILYIAFLLSLTLSVTTLSAQKISIGYIFPAGTQKGCTSEILIGGLNVQNANAVLLSGKGIKAEIITEKEEDDSSITPKKKKKKLDDQSSLQLSDKIRVRVTVAKNAEPGTYDLRLKSAAGISNKLNFEIDQYPQVIENRVAQSGTNVEKLPATLYGQILPGETDCYQFQVPKGMMLVAAVKARALVPYIADAVPGWFQPVMSIYNSKGQELAYCDDYQSQVDPVITLRVPETDTYSLKIHDAIYRGRDDFSYRIELGEIPYVQSVYPAVAKVDTKTSFILQGVNLKTTTLNASVHKEGYNQLTATGTNGAVSNSFMVWGSPKSSTLMIHNPTDSVITDQKVNFDTLDIHTRFKRYIYEAKANENVCFELVARRLGSMLDGRLRLLDADGQVLAESDDVEDVNEGLMTFHADPQLNYQFKEDGKYYLDVEDVLQNSGASCFYILHKKPLELPFQVFASPAILSVARGGTAMLTVNIKSDENNPIRLNFSGLPEGTQMSSTLIPGGVKKKDIAITLPDRCEPGKRELQLSATQIKKGLQEEIGTQTVIASDEMMQAFYYHHHIPASGLSLDVLPNSPYKLELPASLYNDNEYMISYSAEDSVVRIPVKVIRHKNCKDSIELSVYPKNKNIKLANNYLGPDETEKTLEISFVPDAKKPQKQAKERHQLSIVGTVNGEVDKRGKRSMENATYREMTPFIVIQKK